MSNTELHLPGHSYAGPGTKVLSRIINKIKPINDLDKASLIHDIEYSNPQISKFKADNNMWINLMKKDILNLPIANYTRLALFLKDFTPLMNKNKTDFNKYKAMKQLAYENNMIDKTMNFT